MIEFRIRLYEGRDDDLIRWLAGLDGKPYGMKSQAVKDALRRGLGVNPVPTPTGALSQVNLGEIRAVVEAAVENALARLGGIAITGAVSIEQQDDETEALLNSLDAALVIRE